MKRALVRILYGEPDNPQHNYLSSRSRVDYYIKLRVSEKLTEDFVVYCFGEYNYKYLTELGCKNVIMANKDPWIEGEVPFSLLNKIHGWKYAMEDYDEVVFLDWDTVQIKPLPVNFWEELNKKETIQAALVRYVKQVLPWRKPYPEKKMVPNSSFLYMRDKSIPDRMLTLLNDVEFNKEIHIHSKAMWKGKPKLTRQWNDEVYVAKYMDDLCGGWVNSDKYFKLFEPCWHTVKWEVFSKPDACFHHKVKYKNSIG